MGGKGLSSAPFKHNLEHYRALKAMFVAVVDLKLTEGAAEALDSVSGKITASFLHYRRQE